MIRKCFVIVLILSLCACANPLNKETYYRYLHEGANAEQRADSSIAEIAYSRALGNVYMGNLGPEREAEALFNLGRMERLNGKYDLASEHLIKSLEIDETINNAGTTVVKSTLGEIAMTFYDKGDIQQGVDYVDRLSAMDRNVFSSEKSKGFIGELFRRYAEKLRELGDIEKARFYESFTDS